MKKLFAFLIPLFILAACGEKQFTITGEFQGKDTGKLYLKKLVNSKPVDIDTANIENGKFTFTGKVEGAALVFIATDDRKSLPPFFIENSNVKVTAYNDSLNKSVIEGSSATELFQVYMKEMNRTNDFMRQQYQKFQQARMSGNKDKVEAAKIEFEAAQENMMVFVRNFVRTNTSSPVTPLIVKDVLAASLKANELDSIVKTLDKSIHNSQYYKELAAKVSTMQKLAIGGQAPELEGKSPEGKTIKLSDFNGKYLLVDFWASWCKPCRHENPNVVKMYQAYKDKGLAILGVSLDQDANKWKQAIKDDQLTWAHISDLKGFNSEFSAKYQVRAIPATFLLDKDGKIIAKNLRGESLVNKLKELMP
ncbi:AhpC/TSA family protein [Prolixibacteraceae bacterium JC049]|nr:AhpC/TSA family protein [Prolixibacteraceae bacterium JC049]